jgi:thioredoxin-like negative regulator of GroEL
MVFLEITKDKAKKVRTIIKENRCIVLYYWKLCGHCINLLPIWRNAVELEGKNSIIAEIEYDVFPLIQKKYNNISTFPRICVYEHGELKEIFQEKRTLKNIRNFIKKNSIIFDDEKIEKTLKKIQKIQKIK